MPGAARDRMTTETLAWLIAAIAGISSGVIAGAQHEVTTSAIIAIAGVAAIATCAVSRILPRPADPVS